MLSRANSVTLTATDRVTLDADARRSNLAITILGPSGTVEIGGGGGKIPLRSGEVWQPLVAPLGTIDVVAPGEIILEVTGAIQVTEVPEPEPEQEYHLTGNQHVEFPVPQDSDTFDLSWEFKAEADSQSHVLLGGHFNESVYVRLDGTIPDRLVILVPKVGGGYNAFGVRAGYSLQDGANHTYRIIRDSVTAFRIFIDGVLFTLDAIGSSGVSFARAFWAGKSFGGGTGVPCVGVLKNIKLVTPHEVLEYALNDGWTENQTIQEKDWQDIQIWDVGDAIADGLNSTPYAVIAQGDESSVVVGATYRVAYNYELISGRMRLLVGDQGWLLPAGPSQGQLRELRVAEGTPRLRVQQVDALTLGVLTGISVAQTKHGLAVGFIETDWRNV